MARDSKALLASMRSNNTPRNTFRRLAHHGCKEYDSWLGSQRPVSQRFFAVFGGTLVLHGGASLFSQHVRRILFIFINNTQTIYRRYRYKAHTKQIRMFNPYLFICIPFIILEFSKFVVKVSLWPHIHQRGGRGNHFILLSCCYSPQGCKP